RDPAERFQTAAELKTALEDTAREPRQAPSIAVLPFLNLSGDKEDEYFSDGLAEEIINALARLPGLRVAARTSSFAFRGKEMDVREIGTKLQAGRILEGSVRRAGNRIRITAQLVGAADGYHLWSERYDREMADVFDIQEEIAQAIAGKLRVQTAAGQPLIARHTANLEAYNLYLEGRYWWRQATRESWAKAVERFERAIAAEPVYAPPYAGLAVAYTYLSIHGWARPRDVMPAAKQHALKALALEETLAEAHWALAYVHQWFEWNWRAAEREYRRAVALNPGDAHLRMVFSCFLLFIGRTEEALAAGQQAAKLDPVSEEVCRLAIYLDWLAGRFDETEARGRKGIELHPHSAGIHGAFGLALALGGRLGEAVAALRKAGELAAGDPFYACCLGYVYALQERRAEAAAIAEELEMHRRAGFFSPTWLAILYGALGDLERAFGLLECAFEERDSFLVAARADPVFDPLRASLQFAALLGRMGFEA
ncbi:MAG: hypothetical protein IT565_14535, partial [Rhodospirillales bacterium]|nr:hypothetical protein [Rhodospirillales bacterium]